MATPEQFEALHNQYYNKILKFVIRELGVNHMDVNEDLASEVILKAFTHLDTFRGNDESQSSWVYQIAKNSIRDFLRSKKRRFINSHLYDYNLPQLLEWQASDAKFEGVNYESAVRDPNPVDPLEEIIKEEQREHIALAMMSLKEYERKMLVLFYFEKMEQKDIAPLMNIAEGTVKSRMCRIRGKLKRKLENKI